MNAYREISDKLLWPALTAVVAFAISFGNSMADRLRAVERELAANSGIPSTIQAHAEQIDHLSAANVSMLVENANLKLRVERLEEWCKKRMPQTAIPQDH